MSRVFIHFTNNQTKSQHLILTLDAVGVVHLSFVSGYQSISGQATA